MVTLITDILLGVVSFFCVILGLSIGIILFFGVYIPRILSLLDILSASLKFGPKIKLKQFSDVYLLGKLLEVDFCKRLLIGVVGGMLSFAIALFPTVFYYDIRLYLFFLGMDIFLGVLGLTYYRFFVCYPRK